MNELLQEIKEFRHERNWGGNHDARNLAISISLEASELLEHFQWKDATSALSTNRQDVIDEMADVFIYLLQFADLIDADLIDAARQKMLKNALKYPVPVGKE